MRLLDWSLYFVMKNNNHSEKKGEKYMPNTRKYITIDNLSDFLGKLKENFAFKVHGHKLEDISDFDSVTAKFDEIDNSLSQKSQVQIITWGDDD